eukprot:scaffold6781_cov204-Amphora_coffeaeformis.AAC.19
MTCGTQSGGVAAVAGEPKALIGIIPPPFLFPQVGGYHTTPIKAHRKHARIPGRKPYARGPSAASIPVSTSHEQQEHPRAPKITIAHRCHHLYPALIGPGISFFFLCPLPQISRPWLGKRQNFTYRTTIIVKQQISRFHTVNHNASEADRPTTATQIPRIGSVDSLPPGPWFDKAQRPTIGINDPSGFQRSSTSYRLENGRTVQS